MAKIDNKDSEQPDVEALFNQLSEEDQKFLIEMKVPEYLMHQAINILLNTDNQFRYQEVIAFTPIELDPSDPYWSLFRSNPLEDFRFIGTTQRQILES